MVCQFCGESFERAEAIGLNGRFLHAKEKCFDAALRATVKPLKDAVRKAGLSWWEAT